MILLLALACTGKDDTGVDIGDPAPELELPDLTGIDLESAYSDALKLALGVTTGRAWSGHAATLPLAHDGCPDFFAGSPDLDLDMEGGLSWSDHCATAGDLFFRGYVWWDASIGYTEDDLGNVTLDASRQLDADGVVGDADGVIYELDGTAEDALYTVSGESYTRWTYASTLTASLTGRDLFDGTDTPAGWRSDLYLYATGGDAETLELRGNVYFYQEVLQDRFDSVSAELIWAAPESTDPDGCSAEPEGYLSVRDPDAVWYDLVFQPSEDTTGDNYADDPYTDCDGCGTLYVRGIEQGTVCPDLSWVWDGAVTPPTVEDYVLTLREVEAP